jgi:histidinol-phosphatase (PHP family)
LKPPPIDLDGYLECVQRCRDLFPDLRILTGVELGEAHRHTEVAAALLEAGQFDRVLGSMHSVVIGPEFYEMPDAYGQLPLAEVMREYLAEVHRLVTTSDVFAVLAHIDYAARYWPEGEKPFDPWAFQDEFRHVLRALAESGRALEVNTRLPLDADIVRWWRDEGGDAVTFGSDAHEPTTLADGFANAAAMVEALGFRPGRHPHDVWGRR